MSDLWCWGVLFCIVVIAYLAYLGSRPPRNSTSLPRGIFDAVQYGASISDSSLTDVGIDFSLAYALETTDIPTALAQYEALISQQFFGSLPYDRLRIIYTRQKDYAAALRVCQAYLALPDRPNGQNKPHFAAWVIKLQAKHARSLATEPAPTSAEPHYETVK